MSPSTPTETTNYGQGTYVGLFLGLMLIRFFTQTVGIYSITWVFQFLYHLQPPNQRKAPTVASSMTKYSKTGCDEMTSIIMTFPPAGTHGIATTSLRVSPQPLLHSLFPKKPNSDLPNLTPVQVSHDPDSQSTAGAPIRIQGTLGEIQVQGPAYRPTTYTLIPAKSDTRGALADFQLQRVTRDIPGHGMFWEADECARCLRDGKLESEVLSWEESIVIMETMDEVRRQNGLRYPEAIESTEFPLEGF